MEQQKHNVLIIEQQEAIVNRLKSSIGGLYNLTVLGTTTEAITFLNEHWRQYAMIVVALHMPVLDGYMFSLMLKKDANIRDIPIIISGTGVEFQKTKIPIGLRIAEYDRLIWPCENKHIVDILELNLEKRKMLARLRSHSSIDPQTNLFTMGYFKEALEMEVLRSGKLGNPLNCLTIRTTEPEIRENLLSLVKSTCRHYDVACQYKDKILLLVPHSRERDGQTILNRFNSVLYGLKINTYSFVPGKTDALEFKKAVLLEDS